MFNITNQSSNKGMAPRVRKSPKSSTRKLSSATLTDLSLRNHLSLVALGTDYGVAFHLGTIVRTMFASFYLIDAGFGDGDLSIYTEVDMRLSEIADSCDIGRRYVLGSHAAHATARLLGVYDSQLQVAPLDELILAHQRAERNFQESPERRLSIPALVDRSRSRNRDRKRNFSLT